MDANSPRWTTVSDSPHDHEREALAFLRRQLYDRDPYRVWANFEFTAPNGALYEVDALAITDNGVHLIEIKSHPGEIGGDATTWQWVTPEGRRHTFDNPRILANRKAKALREALARTKAFAKRRGELPYINEVVFLSDPDLTVTLSPAGRHQVYGRDHDSGDNSRLPPGRRAIGGIIEALTTLDPDPSGRPRRRIDRLTGARIAEAIEQAGIRERASRRRFGDYRLVELLADVEADRDTGIAYQDFLVEHTSLPDVRRRLRLYPLEQNAAPEQREVARRAAQREFQHLRPLRHPGILAPVDYFDHERGPCLLFDHDPDAQPLDRWLLDLPPDIDALDRLDVVRQVAEALQHAHHSGVFHRALAPSSVLVAGGHRDLRVQVADWHAGARVGTGDTTGSLTGTEHVDALAGGDAALYRAPEHAQPLANPAALDVFSLGCLACTVFTGAPPAATPAKLRQLLATSGHVPADAVGDGVDELLATFVATLTDANPAARPTDLADVLADLDSIEEAWTAPDPADDEPHVTLARRGATLGGGRFEVAGRLGLGSTAFALLVRDRAADRRVCVLKVARTPELNGRLADEARALTGVDHPNIVKLLDGPLDLDGHAALVLSYAGDPDDADRDLEALGGERRGPRTLAARIGEAFDAELTERFGEDLLEAVRHLEEVGVSHRDIKPENLGLAPRGKDDALHLVLFDFSLAGAPADRLDAGTPGYLDPFLHRPGRGRWDLAADRYAAAVVLYELCTGTKPVYGDGTADPGLVDAELRLDPELFDPSVADGLVAFFERALAPDVARRHGNAADMLAGLAGGVPRRPAAGHHPPRRRGRRGRGGLHRPARHHSGHPARRPAAVGPGARRPGAGRHPHRRRPPRRAAQPPPPAARRRRGRAGRAGHRGRPPAGGARRGRRVGAAVRAELVTAVAHLREALAEAAELDDDAPLTVAARALVPRTAAEPAARLLRTWLGLAGEHRRWRTVDELAGAHGGREHVAEVLAGARERWSRQKPVRAVRDWIAEELAAMGGVASVGQLADRLARARPEPEGGLVDVEGEHDRAALAVVRAAVLVEADRARPRWIRRVGGGTAVVALDDPDGSSAASGPAESTTPSPT